MGFLEYIFYFFLSIFFPRSRTRMEYKMFFLLNKDRKRNGLKKLFYQNDLREIARKHSRDMAKKDYFDHEDPMGINHVKRYKNFGLSEVISGENLAKISGFSYPVERAENGLMNSKGHRENILNVAFNCVGIGVHKSESGIYYFTQNFAYRAILFKNKIPKRTNLRKGLKLVFFPASKIKSGFYRVKLGNLILKERTFIVKQRINVLKIDFFDIGHHKIEIYCSESSTRFALSNIIEINVSSSCFA